MRREWVREAVGSRVRRRLGVSCARATFKLDLPRPSSRLPERHFDLAENLQSPYQDQPIPCREALCLTETLQSLGETHFGPAAGKATQQIGLICLSARPVMTDLSLVTELPIGKSSSEKIASRQTR